jgi:hypothetical protein
MGPGYVSQHIFGEKNPNTVSNSITAEAREKMSADLKSLEF